MSNPAPGALETVRAFVNTRDVDDGIEALSGPAELAAWLAEHGLLGDGAPRRARPPPTCAARSSCARRCARTCAPTTASRSTAGAAASSTPPRAARG